MVEKFYILNLPMLTMWSKLQLELDAHTPLTNLSNVPSTRAVTRLESIGVGGADVRISDS